MLIKNSGGSMEAKNKGESKKMEDYEIDSMVESLLRAEEIKADPEKFALALKRLAKKRKAITSIEGLREKANQLASSERNEDKEDSEE